MKERHFVTELLKNARLKGEITNIVIKAGKTEFLYVHAVLGIRRRNLGLTKAHILNLFTTASASANLPLKRE